MKSHLVLAAFLIGVLTASSVSVFARRDQASPQWALASVDVGSIRVQNYKQVPLNASDEVRATADAKTAAEVKAKVDGLTSQGYEPFSATIYSTNIYNNEKVWFFRKKL